MTQPSFVTHLECSRCQTAHDPARVQGLCTSCASPLLVRYDLSAIRAEAGRASLASRPPTMWRYREFLPTDPSTAISLGESITPLVRTPRLGAAVGAPLLSVKDEGSLPTGTFKARGATVGVSRARDLAVRTIAIPTAGNAGAAWAAYCARAGIEAVVVMPETTPLAIQREISSYGARTYLVPGSIADAGRSVAYIAKENGWFDASTLKEPYRIEGKKTMALELAEQLEWRLPDVLVYPTGGGVGLIAIWKAFAEMVQAGWLDAEQKLPRLVSVQSSGCAPIVKAFASGRSESDVWESPETFAAGLRVPKPLGDFLVLAALHESAGTAVAVTDDEIRDAMRIAGSHEGLLLCPEGAAGIAAVGKLRGDGWIAATDEVVVFNTGTGLKYFESLQGSPPQRVETRDELAAALRTTQS